MRALVFLASETTHIAHFLQDQKSRSSLDVAEHLFTIERERTVM